MNYPRTLSQPPHESWWKDHHYSHVELHLSQPSQPASHGQLSQPLVAGSRPLGCWQLVQPATSSCQLVCQPLVAANQCSQCSLSCCELVLASQSPVGVWLLLANTMPASFVQKRKRSFELYTRDGPGFTRTVNAPMLDKAEIDAMQALSPEIFNNKKGKKAKKAKKAKSVSDVPKDCEKLAAHFSKLRWAANTPCMHATEAQFRIDLTIDFIWPVKPTSAANQCSHLVSLDLDHCKLAWTEYFDNQRVPLDISPIKKFYWTFRQSESSIGYFNNQKVIPLHINCWYKTIHTIVI